MADTWLGRIFHRTKEWDEYTHSWVRGGWIAERKALMNAEYARHLNGEWRGGMCNACNLPTDKHPMPERLWRSGPDLCAAARAKVTASG